MTRYAYTEFPPEKEKEGLEAIIAEMRTKGILYVPVTDPRWSWYDDRATPTEYLRETMAARKIMLDRYGPGILQTGDPIGASARHAVVDDVSAPPLGDRGGHPLHRRHVPQHRRQGRRRCRRPRSCRRALQREVLGLLMDGASNRRIWRSRRRCSSQLTPTPGSNLEDLSSDYAFDHLQAARILSALVLEPLLEAERVPRGWWRLPIARPAH